jgi:hypothetical protein
MPITAAMIAVVVMVTVAALVQVPAHNRRAAAADVTDRASMTGKDKTLVVLQIRRTIASEYLNDVAHGAKKSS